MSELDRWQVVELNINDLKPNPDQEEFFPKTNEAEDTAFVDDVERRGQQDPVHVVPDGQGGFVIVVGHRRVAAGKALDWKTIKCIVRSDLAEAGPLAVKEHFIADNSQRRQLSDFERAKCAVALKEIAEERERGTKLRKWEATTVRENMRDWIGDVLGIGGRQVSRLLRVFETSREVQEALRQKQLTLSDVNKIASLSSAEQEDIASLIAEGVNPKVAFRQLAPSEVKAKAPVKPSYNKLIREIGRAHLALFENLGDLSISPEDAAVDLETLERGSLLIGALINKALHVLDYDSQLDELEDDLECGT